MPLSLSARDNPVLRAHAKEIKNFQDPDLHKLIAEMIPFMYENRGIGLAAPQVNVSLRLAVLIPDPEKFDEYEKEKNQALTIINPIITDHSSSTEKHEEGCLSVPGVYGLVKRWKSVTVFFVAPNGEKRTVHASGLLARVFQHEIDHLNGILCIDRAEELLSEPISPRLQKRAQKITQDENRA